MKYFLRILLVLAVSAAVVCGVYYYQHGSLTPGNGEKATLTTVSKAPATERVISKTLLATIKKENISLYKTLDGVILNFKGKEYPFDGFSSAIEKETPVMYYADVDGDKEKEILIKGVTGEDAVTGQNIYSIYVLNPAKDGFQLALAAQDTWFEVLNQYIRIDLKQLRLCNKFLQLTMSAKENAIEYDKETGIAKTGHTGYARALQAADGSYEKLTSLEKGKGEFDLAKDGTISVSVELRAKYENSGETQAFGNIYFEFSVNKNNEFYVTEKTMRFVPNDRYRVVPPAVREEEDFSYTETNASEDSGSGALVWIKYVPQMDEETISQTVNLGEESTEIRHVAKLVVTGRNLVLTAKDGYTFDREPVAKGEYSVDMFGGKHNGVDIAYSASLNNDATELTVTFDRYYSKKELKAIEICYGAR